MPDEDWQKLFSEGEELIRQGRKKEGMEKLRDAARARGMDLGPDLDKDLGLRPSKIPEQSSRCFIATAVYGSHCEPEVLFFRRFRDKILLTSRAGTTLVRIYYLLSPPIARLISKSQFLRWFSRRFLLEPLLKVIDRCSN